MFVCLFAVLWKARAASCRVPLPRRLSCTGGRGPRAVLLPGQGVAGQSQVRGRLRLHGPARLTPF